jgi:transposase
MKTKTPTTHTKKQSKTPKAPKAKQIKLGLDISARRIVVVRQLDGSTPQPAQRYSWAGFLGWAKKQLDLAEEVHSCYEAGPFGYQLHRDLSALGIHNVVVRPVRLDPENRRVKTDRTDALELCLRLDRYVGGNRRAFSVVRVPTFEQELARSESRQREQIMGHRKRWEAQGRSLLLYYGLVTQGRWWRGAQWEKLQEALRPALRALVDPIREETLRLWQMELQHTQALSQAEPALPIGFGGLTRTVLDREMLNWEGFTNRRQVASITGLCPGVSASGTSLRPGPITKRGRRRVRRVLIELAWRLARFQPDYRPVQQFQERCKRSRSVAVKKKAVVALARRIAIDWWRMHTGRSTAQALNLRLST